MGAPNAAGQRDATYRPVVYAGSRPQAVGYASTRNLPLTNPKQLSVRATHMALGSRRRFRPCVIDALEDAAVGRGMRHGAGRPQRPQLLLQGAQGLDPLGHMADVLVQQAVHLAAIGPEVGP